MAALSNARHEAVALAYIADPERLGWRAYQAVYPKCSQHAAETGFSRMLKNVEFCARIAELQAGAADNAEITLESLLRDVGEVHRAAMNAKQYAAANSALKLKAELSGFYNQAVKFSGDLSVESIVVRVPAVAATANEWQIQHGSAERKNDGRVGGTARTANRANCVSGL
jgi:hypothetical protein